MTDLVQFTVKYPSLTASSFFNCRDVTTTTAAVAHSPLPFTLSIAVSIYAHTHNQQNRIYKTKTVTACYVLPWYSIQFSSLEIVVVLYQHKGTIYISFCCCFHLKYKNQRNESKWVKSIYHGISRAPNILDCVVREFTFFFLSNDFNAFAHSMIGVGEKNIKSLQEIPLTLCNLPLCLFFFFFQETKQKRWAHFESFISV